MINGQKADKFHKQIATKGSGPNIVKKPTPKEPNKPGLNNNLVLAPITNSKKDKKLNELGFKHYGKTWKIGNCNTKEEDILSVNAIISNGTEEEAAVNGNNGQQTSKPILKNKSKKSLSPLTSLGPFE